MRMEERDREERRKWDREGEEDERKAHTNTHTHTHTHIHTHTHTHTHTDLWSSKYHSCSPLQKEGISSFMIMSGLEYIHRSYINCF
jgi:hypothetical protein